MKDKTIFINESKILTNSAISILDFISIEDEQERQVLGAFLFGVVNSLAFELKENPINVQGAMIEILINELKYTPKQALDFCQYLIDSTDKENNPTVFAIIHRGMDGYYELKKGDTEDVKCNFSEIVRLVKEANDN
ncbi:MAG: Imm48 family immunity protein [Cellulosilyticaceae bacterium]